MKQSMPFSKCIVVLPVSASNYSFYCNFCLISRDYSHQLFCASNRLRKQLIRANGSRKVIKMKLDEIAVTVNQLSFFYYEMKTILSKDCG